MAINQSIKVKISNCADFQKIIILRENNPAIIIGVLQDIFIACAS